MVDSNLITALIEGGIPLSGAEIIKLSPKRADARMAFLVG